MSGLAPRSRNTALNAMVAEITHVSAHETDPGNTDTAASAEVSVARVPVTWAAAAAGSVVQDGADTIEIAGGNTAAFVSFWSALTGGNYHGCVDTNDEMFTANGDVDVTGLTINIPAGS